MLSISSQSPARKHSSILVNVWKLSQWHNFPTFDYFYKSWTIQIDCTFSHLYPGLRTIMLFFTSWFSGEFYLNNICPKKQNLFKKTVFSTVWKACSAIRKKSFNLSKISWWWCKFETFAHNSSNLSLQNAQITKWASRLFLPKTHCWMQISQITLLEDLS